MERRTVATVVAVAVVAVAGVAPVAGGASNPGPSNPAFGAVDDPATAATNGPVGADDGAANADDEAAQTDGEAVQADGTAQAAQNGSAAGTDSSTEQSPATTGQPRTATEQSRTGQREDPESDVLGWEAGYWYDDPIDVDQTDGLSQSEMDALVARSMARVEYIRRLEFEQEVPVDVVPRSALSGAVAGQPPPPDVVAWRNQVWEALFVDGEDSNVLDSFRNLTSGAVLGFYSPQRDRIVVVTESAANPVVDNATLVHELVHALQDQHFDLREDRFDPRLHDPRLAADGLVEGGAAYVEARYAQRCRSGTWNCVASAPDPEDVEVNRGLHAAVYHPYSDGPPFVASVRARGGWDAVNALYGDPPETTARVIHPGTSSQRNRTLRFESNSRNGWQTFVGQGVDGTQTVGEATVYAMFWYQGERFGIDAIEWRSFERPERGPLDTYNYTSAASDGWVDDVLVPYHRGEAGGYVWRTAWATERDARQFRAAYLEVLRGHDAEQRGPATWVVPDGPFADAFRVRRDGRTVTVVNGPNVTALGQIRPGLNSSDPDSGLRSGSELRSP